MVSPTRVITPEETNRVKESLLAEAATVTIVIAETAHLLIIHLKDLNSQSPKTDIKLLNTRSLSMFYPTFAQTRTTNILLIIFVQTLS